MSKSNFMRHDLDDWLVGHSEYLERRFLFGDSSDFANSIVNRLRTEPGEQSWFEHLRGQLDRNAEHPDIGDYQKDLLSVFASIHEAYPKFNGPPAGVGFETVTSAFSNSFHSLSRVLDLGANETHSPLNNVDPPTENNAVSQALFDLREHSRSLGYWVGLDVLQQTLEQPLLNSCLLSTELSAVAPVLFWNQQAGKGYVAWLQVELFADFSGPFYPNLLKFGLTDISGLMEPMAEVWLASGLSERFRGRWQITFSCPLEDDSDFTKYHQQHHQPDLAGKSLQAAALAAVWAASGSIPMRSVVKEDGRNVVKITEHKTGDQSLKINPRVAISASIDFTDELGNDSIRLGPISEDSVNGKIAAMGRYYPTDTPDASLFDTVLLVEADREKLREEIKDEAELEEINQKSRFCGIHLNEDCETMADALLWMLEVNIWKHELNCDVTSEWLTQWGYARDSAGAFLERGKNLDERGVPISMPIRFQAPESIPDGWDERWREFDNARIALDNDQKITLLGDDDVDLKDTHSEIFNDQLLAQLEAVVIQRGTNTGSLEFMQAPFGGASSEDEIEETEAEESDEVDVMQDAQSE